jgi:hypothetical protein
MHYIKAAFAGGFFLLIIVDFIRNSNGFFLATIKKLPLSTSS